MLSRIGYHITQIISAARKPYDHYHFMRMNKKRAKGIEPSYQAWEACVLPLNYARRTHSEVNRLYVYIHKLMYAVSV